MTSSLPVSEAVPSNYTCGICGFVMNEAKAGEERVVMLHIPQVFQKVADSRLWPDVYEALMGEKAQRLAQMGRETEVDPGESQDSKS